MILDSSAVIAIVQAEPEAERFLNAIVASREVGISAPTALEVSIVVMKAEPRAVARVESFLDEAGVTILAFDAEHARSAQDAYRRFGRLSGHPARLNFGDCISYAAASVLRRPLLFKGDDFIHTDVLKADW